MMKFSTYASRFRSLTRLQYYNPITTKIHQNHAIKQFFSKAQLRNIGYMKSPEKREELLIYFKKKFILARGALVKKRYLELDIPIGGKYTHWYTLSDMCGHGAFLFLAISYLENDFMNLRM